MSQLLRARTGECGKDIGLDLLRQLFGLSETIERDGLELMIKASVKDWVIMNPCLALALICVTRDIRFKIPDQYQWPKNLKLAGLTWHPYLCVDKDRDRRLRSRRLIIEHSLNRYNTEMIGPHSGSQYVLLSLDRGLEGGLGVVQELFSVEYRPLAIGEMIGPFIEQVRPKLFETA